MVTISNSFSIRNNVYISQIVDFQGLWFSGTCPTNIDAFREYRNVCYTIIESKFGDNKPPTGQLLALERMCDDLNKAKPTLLILASHNTPIGAKVDLASSIVTEYRDNGKWIIDGKNLVKELEEKFCLWVERRKTSTNNIFIP